MATEHKIDRGFFNIQEAYGHMIRESVAHQRASMKRRIVESYLCENAPVMNEEEMVNTLMSSYGIDQSTARQCAKMILSRKSMGSNANIRPETTDGQGYQQGNASNVQGNVERQQRNTSGQTVGSMGNYPDTRMQDAYRRYADALKKGDTATVLKIESEMKNLKKMNDMLNSNGQQPSNEQEPEGFREFDMGSGTWKAPVDYSADVVAKRHREELLKKSNQKRADKMREYRKLFFDSVPVFDKDAEDWDRWERQARKYAIGRPEGGISTYDLTTGEEILPVTNGGFGESVERHDFASHPRMKDVFESFVFEDATTSAQPQQNQQQARPQQQQQPQQNQQGQAQPQQQQNQQGQTQQPQQQSQAQQPQQPQQVQAQQQGQQNQQQQQQGQQNQSLEQAFGGSSSNGNPYRKPGETDAQMLAREQAAGNKAKAEMMADNRTDAEIERDIIQRYEKERKNPNSPYSNPNSLDSQFAKGAIQNQWINYQRQHPEINNLSDEDYDKTYFSWKKKTYGL